RFSRDWSSDVCSSDLFPYLSGASCLVLKDVIMMAAGLIVARYSALLARLDRNLFGLIFNDAYDPGRIAAYQRVRRNIVGYYGAGGYNGVVSDGHATNHNGVGRYPDISANHNRVSDGDRTAQRRG